MKKKKLIPVIMALCVFAIVFGGCGTKRDNGGKEYDELNAKLNLNYSKIVLTVKNTFSEESVLASEYTMIFSDGGMTVNYSVERFSEVSLDSIAPAKTKLVGEAVVVGGKVTYTQGEEVNLDAVTAGRGLNFKEDYFENTDLTGIYLIADVKNPSGFMGSALDCTQMKVKATFLEIFHDIKITYRAQNGNLVEYLYDFTL